MHTSASVQPPYCHKIIKNCHKIIKRKKVSKEKRFTTFKESFLVGFASAILFWAKYNMVGLYVGILITFTVISIKDHKLSDLFISTRGVIVGFLTITIPVIGFFAINNALEDLFRVYFQNNLGEYANRLDFLYQGYYALFGTLHTIESNGYYIGGDMYPSVYHFYLTNCMIEETVTEQKRYVEEGLTEYVVSPYELPWAIKYECIYKESDKYLYRIKK